PSPLLAPRPLHRPQRAHPHPPLPKHRPRKIPNPRAPHHLPSHHHRRDVSDDFGRNGRRANPETALHRPPNRPLVGNRLFRPHRRRQHSPHRLRLRRDQLLHARHQRPRQQRRPFRAASRHHELANPPRPS